MEIKISGCPLDPEQLKRRLKMEEGCTAGGPLEKLRTCDFPVSVQKKYKN